MRVHLSHLPAYVNCARPLAVLVDPAAKIQLVGFLQQRVLARNLGLPRVIPQPRAPGAHEICLD